MVFWQITRQKENYYYCNVIHTLRNSAFVKLLWALMGLYILNLSADTPDPESPSIAEDLTINDQESMVEVLVETILGFEDTFEEFDDPDGEDQNKKSTQKINLALHSPYDHEQPDNASHFAVNRFLNPRINLTLGYYQVDSPPPNS